jgi:Uma2 family endonuclease
MNAPAFFKAPDRKSLAKLSIEQYYAICDVGVFANGERTELLDGQIYVINAQYLPHARIKHVIFFALHDSLLANNSSLTVLSEATIELGKFGAPQPDIFIFDAPDALKGAPDGSVKLVAEVADSSERQDLGKKLKLYARGAIPEYWVAVLRTRRIERFTQPVGDKYLQHDSFVFGDVVESVTLPGVGLSSGLLYD